MGDIVHNATSQHGRHAIGPIVNSRAALIIDRTIGVVVDAPTSAGGIGKIDKAARRKYRQAS